MIRKPCGDVLNAVLVLLSLTNYQRPDELVRQIYSSDERPELCDGQGRLAEQRIARIGGGAMADEAIVSVSRVIRRAEAVDCENPACDVVGINNINQRHPAHIFSGNTHNLMAGVRIR